MVRYRDGGEKTMTFDEVERTIQFMIENQARFDARFEANQAQFEARMQKTEEVQGKTSEQLDRLTVQHSALADVVTKLAQSHIELVNSHKRLAQTQTELSDRADTFITFVEKYISRGNEGKKRSH